VKNIEYVTVDGEVVTSDGEPVFVTVENVLKYIDQSQVAINREIRGDIRSWFQNHFDLSETINNAISFINEVYAGLSNILDPSTLDTVINLIRSFLGC
jgi:formylmethanofuran dehydrogenase subunit A